MWLAIIVVLAVGFIVLYEYRLRRPDQLILHESNGSIGFRKARWYPRHFSLPLPGTTHILGITVAGTAKGSLPITVRLVVTVAASRENIPALVRAGGWDAGAVARAAKELDTIIQGQTRALTETLPIEELVAERIHAHLAAKAPEPAHGLGLDIIALAVQSVDPVDPSIAEAMRQRESARIVEQTELISQKARVAAAQAKARADEQIAALQHEIELKKYDLKRAEMEKESALATRSVEDETQRHRLRLALDREEMELLKDNPQLLLLTPQVARLAEASQSLRNARTVISLGPNDLDQGSPLVTALQTLVQNMLQGASKPGAVKTKGA